MLSFYIDGLVGSICVLKKYFLIATAPLLFLMVAGLKTLSTKISSCINVFYLEKYCKTIIHI